MKKTIKAKFVPKGTGTGKKMTAKMTTKKVKKHPGRKPKYA